MTSEGLWSTGTSSEPDWGDLAVSAPGWERELGAPTPHRAAPNPGQSPQDTASQPGPPQSPASATSEPCQCHLTPSRLPWLAKHPPQGCDLGAASGCGGLDSHKERAPPTRLKTENHPRCSVLPLTQHQLCLCSLLAAQGPPEGLELPRALADRGVV